MFRLAGEKILGKALARCLVLVFWCENQEKPDFFMWLRFVVYIGVRELCGYGTMDFVGFGKIAARLRRLWVVLSAVALVCGCAFGPGPRQRVGEFFGSPAGMKFLEPENLGTHRYSHGPGERNGMVYTCRGGFIDIAHVREAADRTAYLAGVSYDNLMDKEEVFSFRVIEPSRYWVKISYPENWDGMSEDERFAIADEVSICLGQYFAHTSLIWHEILTWYGFSSVGIFPEKISSFSWEDSYSDLLGTQLAAEALAGDRGRFDEVMTRLIDERLDAIEVQSAKVSRRAAKKIKGKWYTGGLYFLVAMKKRNFDVGLDDGYITPFLVEGVGACADSEPEPYPVPNLDLFWRYGFEMELEIEPLTLQKGSIYRTAGVKEAGVRLQPEVHFPKILARIESNGG